MAYRIGRYEVHEAIASGGMAVVHLGRMVGPIGFSRTVAIKRLHPHLATDPEFVAMFLDEARLAARVQHPNVVATLDVVASHGQLFLVMDYVLGAPLSQLVRSAEATKIEAPPAVVSAIVAGALYGLHAAHEARDERGELLGVVHRDVSPQNLLVGVDGVTRVVDFGVAKAAARAQSTREGQLKGKLAYMAPEQIRRKNVDRRADVYAAGVVLWELLAQRRLFRADDEVGVIAAVLEGSVPRLAKLDERLPAAIDDVLERALATEAEARFATAQDFAAALETAIPPAPQREVGAWVAQVSGKDLESKRMLVAAVEQTPALGGQRDDEAIEGLIGHRLSEDEAQKLATALTSSLPYPSAQGSIAPSARAGKTRRWAGGALVALLVASGVAYASVRWTHARSKTVAVMPSPASSPEVAPSASSPVVTLPETAVSTPTATPVAHRHAAPRPVARPTHASTPAAPPAASGAPSCDPPFTVDPNGIRRFKPWCL